MNNAVCQEKCAPNPIEGRLGLVIDPQFPSLQAIELPDGSELEQAYGKHDDDCVGRVIQARIVACWNACEGTSNELLSHGQVQPLSRYSTVVNQREELLRALKAVDREWRSDPMSTQCFDERLIQGVREAIDRADGVA